MIRALLSILLATTAAQAKADDFVLPGTFTRDTTLAELRTRYGAANVVEQTLDGAEGETFPGLVLFPDDATRRAEIIPREDPAHDGISAIRVNAMTSKWKLDTGVHPGMTLAQLVALNGQPITFSGLDWDYGGAIQQWHGGKLEPEDGGAVFRSLRLTRGDDAPENSYPLGDGDFRSDDRKFPKQGEVMVVGEIMVSFLDPVAE